MPTTPNIAETRLRCRLLTASGVGAIAVLRVEGVEAWRVVRERVKGRARPLPEGPQNGRVYFGDFFDGDDRVDDVIVAPQTQNAAHPAAVDICCHGGRRVVERIMLALQGEGAQIVANPWENQNASTWQEALEQCADYCLSQATTHRGVEFLLAQRRLLPAFFELLLGRLDDSPNARRELTGMIEQSNSAQRLFEPAELIWVGEPNVGKSSLINRLAGRESAIVHGEAGTTRDWVSVDASLKGVPVTLIDTAGFRIVSDPLETQAVEQGRRRAANADLIIEVVAVDAASDTSEHKTDTNRWGRAPDLRVLNKSDLVDQPAGAIRPDHVEHGDETPVVRVSAHTGAGLDELRAALISRLGLDRSAEWTRQPILFDPGLRDRIASLCSTGDLTRAGVCRAIEDAARDCGERRRAEGRRQC